MVRRNSPRATIGRALFALALGGSIAMPASAQDGLLRKLNIDQLEIQSLGVSFGRISPSQLQAANVYGLQGDYGNIAPAWRIVFGASYWESRFDDDVVQAFADSLRKSLSDPTTQVFVSPIRVYDVTFSGDARYTPQYNGWVKPFGGVGIAAHVINAEGRLIKGTFVERSLDDIAGGLYATGGITLRLLPHFGIEASARGDLLSGFRSTQIKVNAAYILGHRRDSNTPEGDSGAHSGSGAHDRSKF